MDNQKWPRGLVSYTSENALNGKKTTLLKPKTLGYGVILTTATAVLIWSIATRSPYTAMVEQIRQPLYTQLSDGSIRNVYEVKLNNKLTAPMTVGIRIEGLAGATLDMDGMERIGVLEPQERIKLLARVRIPPLRSRRTIRMKRGTTRMKRDELEHAKVTFVVEALAGATAKPIRRNVPFYVRTMTNA